MQPKSTMQSPKFSPTVDGALLLLWLSDAPVKHANTSWPSYVALFASPILAPNTNHLHFITETFCQCDVALKPTQCVQVVPHNPLQTPYTMHQSTCSSRTLDPNMHMC
jgi:hypothetical protein